MLTRKLFRISPKCVVGMFWVCCWTQTVEGWYSSEMARCKVHARCPKTLRRCFSSRTWMPAVTAWSCRGCHLRRHRTLPLQLWSRLSWFEHL